MEKPEGPCCGDGGTGRPAAASFDVDGPDAPPAPNPGAAAAGERKRKAPAVARKPRKPKLQDQPIQIPVCYGHREMLDYSLQRRMQMFPALQGDDLDNCLGDGIQCPHVMGELPPQPWLMSLVDLKLWIFKLFRLHPETQDLAVKGFIKQHKIDLFDEQGPEWYLQYIPWDNHYFHTEKCWRSFAKKLKRKRNVVPKFMLFVESSEIKHYNILLKVVNDDYSVVLPEKEVLTVCHFRSRFLDLEDLTMTPSELVACVSFNYGKQISPPEAWRARQHALEREFGTFYESYNIAPRLIKNILCENPGGFVDIKDTEVVGYKDFRVLQRIFWAFAQCLVAFQHCRPVLCVKGTPLCGKYQGVLLTAVALDANDYSIPVACAVVEGETKESWLWFLRNLERALVMRSDVCIIHDYKIELINAVKDLLNSPQMPCIWKDSRWCMEHLAENFLEYFRDEKLMMMFKKLCQQRQLHKFSEMWMELDDLTSKYMSEKEGAASGEILQGAVEHGEADFEAQIPCNQPDSMKDGEEGDLISKRKITKFSDWIRLKPKEKWSLLYDRNGARYGITGNNIADLYKHDPVLKGIMYLPLLAIVKVTFQRMVKYFEDRSASANKAIADPSMNFPERVQDDINSEMQKAQMHQVIFIDNNKINLFGGKQVLSFTVQSREKNVIVHTVRKLATCSCNKPQLLHNSCSHVIAVCCKFGIKTAKYMSPYYSLTYLGSIWSVKFNLPRDPCYDVDIMTSERVITWIPDKRWECGLPVFLTLDCVQTSADEEEQQCNN